MIINNNILIEHSEINENVLFLLIHYFVFLYILYYVVMKNIPDIFFFESKNIFLDEF